MNSTILNSTKRFAEDYISTMNKAEGPCYTCAFSCEGGGANYHLHSKQFRNRLKELPKTAAASHFDKAALEELMARGERLAGEKDQWSGDYVGVCIHLAKDRAEVLRLQSAPVDTSHLGSSFLFRPASDALASRVKMLALHLAFKSPQLFCYSGHKAKQYAEIVLPDSVYSFSEDGAIEPGQHAHVRQSTDGNAKNIVNQGFGPALSPRDRNEPVYLVEVAHALCELEEVKDLPLVVLGDEAIVGEFVKVYQHPQGTVFRVTDADAHPDEAEVERVCSELARSAQGDAKENALQTIKNFDMGSELFCDNLKEAYEAATQSRIQVCIVASDEHAWSRYDEAKGGLSSVNPDEDPDCFDAYDRVYAETTARGGDAIVVPADQVPGEKKVAAILRW